MYAADDDIAHDYISTGSLDALCDLFLADDDVIDLPDQEAKFTKRVCTPFLIQTGIGQYTLVFPLFDEGIFKYDPALEKFRHRVHYLCRLKFLLAQRVAAHLLEECGETLDSRDAMLALMNRINQESKELGLEARLQAAISEVNLSVI